MWLILVNFIRCELLGRLLATLRTRCAIRISINIRIKRSFTCAVHTNILEKSYCDMH